MQDSKKFLDWVMFIKEIQSIHDLAKLFNVADSTVSSWRNRDIIPDKRVIAFCKIAGLSIDKVMSRAIFNTQASKEYQHESINRSIKEVAELGTMPCDIDGLLNAARKILTSGNQAAVDALERNIRYFSHTIDIENRLKRLEQARINNEKRIASLEERKKIPYPGVTGETTAKKAT